MMMKQEVIWEREPGRKGAYETAGIGFAIYYEHAVNLWTSITKSSNVSLNVVCFN
jgi:hypothetical protein